MKRGPIVLRAVVAFVFTSGLSGVSAYNRLNMASARHSVMR